MAKQRKCKDCGKLISIGSRYGKCCSCAAKARDRLKEMDGRCKRCNNPITRWNKSGYCTSCTKKGYNPEYAAGKGGNTNVKKKQNRIYIPCYKCKKKFYAKANQHRKYSLCPACKEENERITHNRKWLGGDVFTNYENGRIA